ncbi:MAG: signal peptide peptidase SppA [Lentilitoribacter sp.]
MDQNSVFDRHNLRRKLRFWRIATVLVVLLIIGSIVLTQNDEIISGDHIARVEINGIIQDDDELIARLDGIAEDEYAKALILTISSPGGTTFGGERIYKAIKRVSEKKPVVADIRTLAASAGYMIAAASDHIVAGETSIVGSIGVIFQYPQVSELLEKIGVSYEEIKSSPLKAEPSPFHPASDEAVAMINSMVIDSYDWFVDLVAENRNLTRAETLKIADGSIFTGRQSLENKLVDSLGGEAEIRAFLETKEISKDLEIIERRKPRVPQAPFLMGSFEGIIQKILGFDSKIPPNWLKDQKLFLDGLLSVWQFGNSTQQQN